METLVPERFREIHPKHRDGYFEEPRTRGMGLVELYAIRKAGKELRASRQETVERLAKAIEMHDVGKVATRDGILRKQGPLTPKEREEMQRHTTVGYQILADSESELLRLAATIALTHHEHWDGGGYPQGLVGERIPIEGRITAVADVFDARLSDRCYRPALPVEEAVEVMKRGSETVAQVFFARGCLSCRMADS